MGRPLRAQSPNPGDSAAHPLNQQGHDSVPDVQEKTHVFSNGNHRKSWRRYGKTSVGARQGGALVRNREKAANWASQGVELVDGDWNDSRPCRFWSKGFVTCHRQLRLCAQAASSKTSSTACRLPRAERY